MAAKRSPRRTRGSIHAIAPHAVAKALADEMWWYEFDYDTPPRLSVVHEQSGHDEDGSTFYLQFQSIHRTQAGRWFARCLRGEKKLVVEIKPEAAALDTLASLCRREAMMREPRTRPRRANWSRDATFLARFEAGETDEALAKEFGVSLDVVRKGRSRARKERDGRH